MITRAAENGLLYFIQPSEICYVIFVLTTKHWKQVYLKCKPLLNNAICRKLINIQNDALHLLLR